MSRSDEEVICVCGTEIEWVPTPPGCSPEWHPPWWRHVELSTAKPHQARPKYRRPR